MSNYDTGHITDQPTLQTFVNPGHHGIVVQEVGDRAGRGRMDILRESERGGAMSDNTLSNGELYAVMINPRLYHGGEWGSNAAHKELKKKFSGRDCIWGRVGATPNDELRELVAEWREKAKYDTMLAQGYNGAADELEALIEE